MRQLRPEHPVGRFRVRAGDLVLVDDPHVPRTFLAEITGSYALARTVYVQLAAPPGVLAMSAARQSTKAKNIKRAWRLAGRAQTDQE